MDDVESWGRYPKTKQRVKPLNWLFEPPDFTGEGSFLPFGLGRSYGDVCLNHENTVICTKNLTRLISFDPTSAVLKAEAGVSLADVLTFAVPRGFFLPVTPGTKFVTLGGAVANDVHGKNHHRAGTFGCFVKELELLRSDGSSQKLSAESNPELFCATIAGLGLTGLITTVSLQLQRVDNAWIEMESVKFGNLDRFFELAAESDINSEFTVAWLDCVSSGKDFGRGIFMRGNFAKGKELCNPAHRQLVSIPFDFPEFALNKFSIKAFNALYYGKQRSEKVNKRIHFNPFFYPLDAVGNWNRIYGKRGLLQFQCVVPDPADIRVLLKEIVAFGEGSFLAVIKKFGDMVSPGMLSFPAPGYTLCLDFPMRGIKTLDIFKKLEEMVNACGGRLYAAKDACMSGASFRKFYPRLEEFSKHIDPRFSSSFWRRVN